MAGKSSVVETEPERIGGVRVRKVVGERIRRSQRAPTLRRPAVGLGHGRQRIQSLGLAQLVVVVAAVVVVVIIVVVLCATAHVWRMGGRRTGSEVPWWRWVGEVGGGERWYVVRVGSCRVVGR